MPKNWHFYSAFCSSVNKSHRWFDSSASLQLWSLLVYFRCTFFLSWSQEKASHNPAPLDFYWLNWSSLERKTLSFSFFFKHCECGQSCTKHSWNLLRMQTFPEQNKVTQQRLSGWPFSLHYNLQQVLDCLVVREKEKKIPKVKFIGLCNI